MSGTKKEGITKPIAVPTIFTTAKIANANDLYFYIISTFFLLNHLSAILVGAFRINGCPIAQKSCPAIAKEKDTFTRQRIPEPNAVLTAPAIIPFLIPF